MNASKKTWLALGLAVAGLTATGAEAANPSRLNINVSITQNLSVSVNNAQTSTNTVAWNTGSPNERLVPVGLTTSTVLNDSGGTTERWQLSTNLNTMPVSGTDAWTLSVDSSAVAAEQFALQAVFGSSNTAACPIAAAADWDQDTATEITTTPEFYTSTRFADAALDGGVNGGTPNPDVPANGRMNAGSFRALCWRVITPASTVASATQNIQLTVTAFAP
jgi:hypothetical protein